VTAPPAPFAGAVLCGGASRRMGADKALLEVDGEPMALRVARSLRAAGAAEVFAVGGDASGLAALGLLVVADDSPGEGPLPATLTALEHASHDMVVVLSCDLVHPSPAAIAAVLDALHRAGPTVLAAVPVAGGHHQWTHAAWRRVARHPLGTAQAGGARSLRRAASELALCEVSGIDARLLADADTPADLADGVRRTRSGRR